MTNPEQKSDEIGTKYVVKREKRLSRERSRRGLGSSHVSTLPQLRPSRGEGHHGAAGLGSAGVRVWGGGAERVHAAQGI